MRNNDSALVGDLIGVSTPVMRPSTTLLCSKHNRSISTYHFAPQTKANYRLHTKKMLDNKRLYSLICSSSQANSLRRHFHPSSPPPQPNVHFLHTVTNRLFNKSYNCLNMSRNSPPTNRWSHYNKVLVPSPTTLTKLVSYQLPTPNHEPLWMA